MAKKHDILEWTILSEDERNGAEFPQKVSYPEPALPHADWRKLQWWSLLTVLLVSLCGSAVILWYQANEGVAQIEAELDETIKLESWLNNHTSNGAQSMLDERISMNWQFNVQNEQGRLPLTFDEHTTITVAELNIDQDAAAVQIVLDAGSDNATYRQTRFYRRTDEGWLRTAPDVTLWGPLRRLETDYFIFEFHQRDAQAVAAVAVEIDTLYTTLVTNFGLPVALTGPKFHIEVSLTQIPGTIPTRIYPQDPFRIPSPALYLAPVGLTDADLLAQSLALVLIEHVSGQATQHYPIQQEWPPMLGGLRLWQLWDLDLPLSAWQDEVVRWTYSDVNDAKYDQSPPLPEHYTELCTTHLIWLGTPQEIKVPLKCDETDGAEMWLTRWTPLLASMPPTRGEMPVGDADGLSRMYGMEHPGKAVALATIFEYAVVTYGREQLPALIAGLGPYEGWETLLPAVLGVSAADFEAGWQMYLVDHYGITLEPEERGGP